MQVTSIPQAVPIAPSAQKTANLVSQSLVYSADIGGKTYTADIASAAGDFVATVPNHLPPISASGSSLILAENNLNAIISLTA